MPNNVFKLFTYRTYLLYLVSVDLCWSYLGKCWLCVWNGEKHICASDCIPGSDSESSEQQKTMYSCWFCWFLKGLCNFFEGVIFTGIIVDMSSIITPKRCLQFLGKSSHYMQNEQYVSNRLHGSRTMTVANCELLITHCETQSRHMRQWNLKKSKSSKLSKLKENWFMLIALKSKQW